MDEYTDEMCDQDGWYDFFTGKNRKVVWQCNGKFKNKCKTPHLSETEIKTAFVYALNSVVPKREFYIKELTSMMDSVCDLEERRRLDKQLEIDWKAVNDLINENARVVQNQTEYEEKYRKALDRYKETETKRNEVINKISEQMTRRKKMERFIEKVRELPETITEFDQTLWNVLVERAIVEKERIVIRFNGGVEVAYKRT